MKKEEIKELAKNGKKYRNAYRISGSSKAKALSKSK